MSFICEYSARYTGIHKTLKHFILPEMIFCLSNMARRKMMGILKNGIIIGLICQIATGQTNVISTRNLTCTLELCSCCLETVMCSADGLCIDQCKDGYFGGRCFSNCPVNCVACKDVNNPTSNSSLWGVANCTTCKPGYYSTSEYYQCQFTCPGQCATCNSATDCTSCKTGYYMSVSGVECLPCSSRCSSPCNLQTGICSCRPGFGGERCDQCAPNTQTYPECDQCIPGFSGSTCGQPCSANCQNNVCDKYDGICMNGCKGNFAGDHCINCNKGWYGTACDVKCPANCLGGSCNQSTGYCESCKPYFAGYTCNACVTGLYGPLCDLSCPLNCKDVVCGRETGFCYSCNSGSSGDRCCLEGPGCQSCSSASVCSECDPGKHGEQCDSECPNNCENKTCDKVTGNCITCGAGFQGDICNISSSVAGAVNRPPTAAIVGGLAGSMVVVGVLVGIIFVLRRRNYTGRCCQDTGGSLENPGDLKRRLHKYQEKQLKLQKFFEDKNAKYAGKISSVEIQLDKMNLQPNKETRLYENTGMDCQTYESLHDHASVEQPYDVLRK